MKIENRKAHFDYFIEKTYEAGIVLLGSEVKGIKDGRCNLKGSFIKIMKNEVFMFNVHISNIDTINAYQRHDEVRERKLLLHRKEINKLNDFLELNQGYTLVPLEVYTVNGLIKCKFGLCKGKKLYDKRESLKQKDITRYNEQHI